MKKTSQSDPLRIDSVQVNAFGGEIGMTLCPGKKDRGAVSGDWDRDLDGDLAAIAEWGATAVLSLMEPHEFERLGVARMQMDMPAGIQHFILPIVDGAVPSGTWERAWAKTGPQLRDLLALGGRIRIHCRGGLGRTGMVAARILIELGEEPATAMARVRKARPGAIENRGQEKYVRRQKPLAAILSRPSYPDDPDRISRYRGCLLGGAVGDALGAPVEFMDIERIRSVFGTDGISDFAPYSGRLGAITDDTQMTLFTAEGLLRAANRGRLDGIEPNVPTLVAHAYQRWLLTQGEKSALTQSVRTGWLIRNEELFARRAPGITCLSALREMNHNDVAARNDSKGCGGVMRMAPVGLFVPGLNGDASRHGRESFELGCVLAGITHGHLAGQHAAGALAFLVLQLVEGVALGAALEEVKAVLADVAGSSETLEAITLAMRLAGQEGNTDDHLRQLGQGWIAEEALAIAIYCAMRSKTFEEGIVLAVNITGDSDSTGSIAGNLLGAMHGIEAIPSHWLESLELRDVITEVADDLLSWPRWPVGEYSPDDPDSMRDRAYWIHRYPGE